MSAYKCGSISDLFINTPDDISRTIAFHSDGQRISCDWHMSWYSLTRELMFWTSPMSLMTLHTGDLSFISSHRIRYAYRSASHKSMPSVPAQKLL